MPYSGTYSGNSDAFGITNTGAGGLANFTISNYGSSGDALYAETNGIGNVLNIRNNGTSDALHIYNDTEGDRAIEIYNYGEQQGLYIRHYGDDDEGLYITCNGDGDAAYFNDNVTVTGNLSKGGGSFKIDHPLDPENKYLYHSFVESPDMMNVYNGNIVLDYKGEAVVELPDWFEALNMEYRFQLTCIGGFAQVYISEEIQNNTFKIAGGISGLKVSWQVTGVRQDPWANENRINIEVEKPNKFKGHYLHYKEYNQPIEKSIEAVKDPEILKEKLNQDKEK